MAANLPESPDPRDATAPVRAGNGMPWSGRADGWHLRAAPAVADPGATARAFLARVPEMMPAIGEAPLRERLAPAGRLLRWRRYRAALVLDESPVGSAHVKVYTPRDVVDLLIETVTASRAWTSWTMGRAMAAAGIPTPAPVLLLLRKPLRIHRASLIVTEGLEDAVTLLAELKTRAQSGAPTRGLLEDVARLAAAFHRAGFFHGDFTARNILLAGPATDRRLWLIDLDRTKRLRWLPGPIRRRIQLLDLRLLLLTTWVDVPRRTWLRIVAIYLRALRLPRPARKRYARMVLTARRGRFRLGAKAPALAGRTPWPDDPGTPFRS